MYHDLIYDAKRPAEGQKVMVTERVVDEDNVFDHVAEEVATYGMGMFWVDGIAVSVQLWRPLTFWEHLKEWFRKS